MKKRKIFIILALALCLCLSGFLSLGIGSADAKNIIKGDSAENIKIVQQRLLNLGHYSGKVDGLWGSRTLSAVKKFQKSKGLVADGIVGTRTESALKVTLKGGASSGAAVGNKDLDLLSRCIYGESRGEPYTGQVAVGAVILNRVRSSKFPNTISGVIYEPYAFTAVADGQINLTANESCKKAAQDALNGWDPTNGCLYYYNPATATSKWIWTLKVELKIGRHSFARA